MTRINNIKLKSLEKTKAFYNFELKKKDLTEKRRNEFLKAKKIIDKIIREKEESLEIEIERDKYFSKIGGY